MCLPRRPPTVALGRACPLPLGVHARPLTTTTTGTTTGRADHIPSHLWRGRSLLALEAVRGISGGASLSTLGGRAHIGKHTCNILHARRTGFSHETELPRCPGYGTLALRFAFAKKGERQTYAPLSPYLGVSKHPPSVNKSSICGTKKSPILGMCSGPPRYYNLIRRQAGCPHPSPRSHGQSS